MYLEKTELAHKYELLEKANNELNMKFQHLEDCKMSLDKEIVELNVKLEELNKQNNDLHVDANQLKNEYNSLKERSTHVI